jgi:glycosyltransferase involved in cell wall biosynthesis
MASTSTVQSAAPAASPEPSSFERLTLVLPAYNEAARIGLALDELFGWLNGAAATVDPPLPPRIRVLVVDDGSTDRTAHLVLDHPAAAVPEDAALRLELLRVPHGGKGAAVRAGMLAGDGDVLVFADADMATPPSQIPRLLAALAAGADVALGSRIQPDGSDMRASQPGYRRFLGRVFHALASIWVVGPVQDTQCGFKGFRRPAAREIFGRQLVTSIVFDVELIHLARRLGCRLAIVPVQWSDIHGSRMRPRLGLAIRVAWDLFRIPLLHRRVRG